MKLYIASFSPNPRRVRIYLAEKGLTDNIEQIRLDLPKGEHRTPAFRANKNPLGTLPVLELDDGKVLTESAAIIEYLEELFPEPPLIGTDPWQRALTREANGIAGVGMLAAASIVFQNVNPFFTDREFTQSETTAEYGRAKYARFLARIDNMLGESAWLAGSNFTIADITAVCAVDFAGAAGMELDPQKHSNVERWISAARQRPSCALKKKPASQPLGRNG